MSTELQVLHGTNAAHKGLSNFSREEIDTIKRTVAKGVTDAELSMFLTICGRYQLDPFLKEIWCYKRQKKGDNGRYMDDPTAPAIIMTSRDGYLKVAQRDQNFDGMKSFVVREGDTFEIDTDSDKIIHKFGAKRGQILGAWAAVYHKQRRPVIVYVDYSEYKSGTTTWTSYPSAMIQKVAEAFGLKRQFGINGLVTQEEMPIADMDIPDGTMPQQQPLPAPNYTKEEWIAAINELNTLAELNGLTGEELRVKGKQMFGNSDPRAWTLADIADMKNYIEANATPETKAEEPEFELPSDDELPF